MGAGGAEADVAGLAMTGCQRTPVRRSSGASPTLLERAGDRCPFAKIAWSGQWEIGINSVGHGYGRAVPLGTSIGFCRWPTRSPTLSSGSARAHSDSSGDRLPVLVREELPRSAQKGDAGSRLTFWLSPTTRSRSFAGRGARHGGRSPTRRFPGQTPASASSPTPAAPESRVTAGPGLTEVRAHPRTPPRGMTPLGFLHDAVGRTVPATSKP